MGNIRCRGEWFEWRTTRDGTGSLVVATAHDHVSRFPVILGAYVKVDLRPCAGAREEIGTPKAPGHAARGLYVADTVL